MRALVRSTLVLALALALAPTAPAWNPISASTAWRWSTTGQPVAWNPDGGTLGMLDNATAVALVGQAFGVWDAVATSKLAYAQGGQIVDASGTPVDVTLANYSAILDLQNGQNPIIFDNDREIYDALGLPAGVLGFAGPLYVSGGEIVKGYAVIQGDWIDGEGAGTPPSDPGETTQALMLAVTVHEIGHFNGLGHSSVNHELSAGLNGCPKPGVEYFATMTPFASGPDLATLHQDEIAGISALYPTPAFNNLPIISGVLVDRDGTTPFDGANVVLRPDTADCAALYGMAQAMQSGVNAAEDGGPGAYRFHGLESGGYYTLMATSIGDGGSYPIGANNPPQLSGPDDYWNGPDEDFFDAPDDPTGSMPVAAGATAVDIYINNPDTAGSLPESGPDALKLVRFDGTTTLAPQSLVLDDGGVSSAWGFSGTTQQAWINRLELGGQDYPFRLERIDLMFWHTSAPPGRPIRLLVYVDESGSGDPGNATLVYSEDSAIQSPLSFQTFQEFLLATPVTIPAGDVWLGAFDLVADAETNFIAAFDRDTTAGAAWHQVNGTDPAGFSACGTSNPYCNFDRAWMVRGFGRTVPAAGDVALTWGDPCNVDTLPDQDFAVYEGSLASLRTSPDHAPLTCSTFKRNTWLLDEGGDSRYYLITPRQATREGPLGLAPAATCSTPGPATCSN